MTAVATSVIGDVATTAEELPEAWANARAGDVLALVNGFPFKPSHWKGSGLPIIRIQNLNNPEAPFNYCPDHIPEKYAVERGDLLFAWSGTPGTSFGAHVWNGARAWLNQHIFRVEFDDGLFDKRFLRLSINHNLDEYISQAQGGVGLAHITKRKFDASYLALPPLAEQKRIVEKVEQLLARVNAARERLARVPIILKRFRQAVLAAACFGRLTADWRNDGHAELSAEKLLEEIGALALKTSVPDGDDPFEPPEIPQSWRWVRCENVCKTDRPITYGVIKLGPPIQHGVATLRSSDVRWLRIDDSQIKHISQKIAAAYARTLLKGGEVLVTVRGSLGGVAVVPPEMVGFNISREVAMLPVHSNLNAKFFSYAIGCASSQAWLSQVTIGVAYTGINIRDLKRLPVPIPPLEEQREIVSRVETLFKFADAIERRVAAAMARAEKLTQAILAKVFRGELVPTEAELSRREGRSYESASELLARIRATTASQNGQDSPLRQKVRSKSRGPKAKSRRA